MFHLAAYYGSKGAAADDSVPGLVDAALSRSATSNQYIFQQRLQLLAAWANSTTLDRCKIVSPTLRMVNPPFLRPVYAQARPANKDLVCWMGDQPLWVPALEEVGPLVTNTAVANEDTYVLMWLADAVVPVPPGPIFTARATASFTAVAKAWTIGSFTFDQSLPTGTYAVVGSECYSTTQVAHRIVFPNQVFRPGSLSHQTANDVQDFRLATRRLGMYGSFQNTAPPLLEILCTAADTSAVVFLQLIPVNIQIPNAI